MKCTPGHALTWIALAGCNPSPTEPSEGFADRSALLADYVQWEIPETPGEATCDIIQQMGGGAAVGDVDGDGHFDLYLPRDGLPDALLFGDGEGFVEAPAWLGDRADGDHIAASLADLDGDGDLDLLRGGWHGHFEVLLQEDGELARSQAWSLGRGSSCTGVFGASVADIDQDGDLDVLAVVYEASVISASRLFVNDGNGRFTDETAARGVDLSLVHAFTAAFTDLDGDGWVDLLVAGDFATSRLFLNDGGTFVERTQSSGFATDENGMGLAVGDIDGDGNVDAFVSAIWDDRELCSPAWGCSGNRLYLGRGDGSFEDATDAYGVRNGGWAWGVALLDHDLDGDQDIALTNGYPKPWPWADPNNDVSPFDADPTRLWTQLDRGMEDQASALGLAHTGPGRALVAFDWHRDGDPDLLIIENGAAPKLFENHANADAWIVVDGPIGTQVEVDDADRVQHHTLDYAVGFASSGPSERLFALGDAREVTVRWRVPGGTWREQQVDAGTHVVLD
ncbi:MAG: VCBS repeat-containing protein [Deltaproteobacteria bacterium]|nr:MAG: VCBS repeat-containing protein [Deltaproteobacteria bacterium]